MVGVEMKDTTTLPRDATSLFMPEVRSSAVFQIVVLMFTSKWNNCRYFRRTFFDAFIHFLRDFVFFFFIEKNLSVL